MGLLGGAGGAGGCVNYPHYYCQKAIIGQHPYVFTSDYHA
jgi:hypothetical protein